MSETISRGQVLAAFRAYLGQRVYIMPRQRQEDDGK